ncbi:hypothetical protein BGW80DRAFT_1256107 [Lactifluus volemus]|nr:hypothetical protein BGW80DRAFT_1256107 [Lactifluus volemus]
MLVIRSLMLFKAKWVFLMYKFMRQGVTLIGLGSPMFTRALEVIENIYFHFDRHLQEGTLDKHSTTVRGDGVSDELNMWNRDDKGIIRYERCQLHMFRAGDLVEVQLSFVVIPVKGGHRKMLAVLRSLALIKGNFKKKAQCQK